MEAALAVEGPDGRYREVDGPGYTRATVVGDPPFARFPQAGGAWGVVRAWAVVAPGAVPDFRPLAAPRLVLAGWWATLHVAEGELVMLEVAEPEPVAEGAAPDETAPVAADAGRLGRWLAGG